MVDRLRDRGDQTGQQPLPADLAEAYKFADVLPPAAATALLDARDRDPETVERVTALPVHSHRLPARGPRP